MALLAFLLWCLAAMSTTTATAATTTTTTTTTSATATAAASSSSFGSSAWPGLYVRIRPALLPVGKIVNLSVVGTLPVFQSAATLKGSAYALRLSAIAGTCTAANNNNTAAGNASSAWPCELVSAEELRCQGQVAWSSPGRVLAELLLMSRSSQQQQQQQLPVFLTSFTPQAYLPPQVLGLSPTKLPQRGGAKLRMHFLDFVEGIGTVDGGSEEAVIRFICADVNGLSGFRAIVDMVVNLEAGGRAVVGRSPRMEGCSENASVEAWLALDGLSFEDSGLRNLTVVQQKKLRIGFLMVGSPSDFGWNFRQNMARQRLENVFGQIETISKESVSWLGPNVCDWCRNESSWDATRENWNNAPPSDYSGTHETAQVSKRWIEEEGVQMIFGTSFYFQWDIYALATRYPNVYFVHAGGWLSQPNMVNLFPKMYQARYLSGIALGWYLKKNPQLEKRVGFISSFLLGETVRAINAFKLGLEQVDPAVEVYVTWIHSWDDERKEKLTAERLIKAYGVEGIAQHTDSQVPQLVARDLGKVGLGYNTDMLFSVGDTVLTSPVLQWDEEYTRLVTKVLDGGANFGEVKWMGAEEQAWRLSDFSPLVPSEAKAQVQSELELLRTGKDYIFCRPQLTDNKGRVRNDPQAPNPAENPVPREAQHLTPGTSCLTDDVVKQSCQQYDVNGNCVEFWLLDGVHDSCSPSPSKPEGIQAAGLPNGTCFLGPLDLADKCPDGQHLTLMGCTLAAPGFMAKDEKELPCPLGFEAPLPGMSACVPCQAGYVAGNLSSIHCSACEPGSYSDAAGLATCKPCSGGSSAPQSGANECQLCAPSRFAGAGQATCDSCESVLSGSGSSRGAASSAECSCPAGTYRLLSACAACPEGVFCLGGSERPRQKAGYWASTEEPFTSGMSGTYSVLLCRDRLQCPDGTALEPTEHCAEGREGVACNDCKRSFTRAEDGRCKECGEASALTFAGPAVVVTVFGIAAMLSVKNDVTKQDLTMLTLVTLAGQLVTAAQSLGAVRSLSIQWVQPLKALLDIMAVIVSFDFDVLNVSCFLGKDDPVISFLTRLFVFPFISASLFAGFLVSKKTSRPSSFDSWFNLNGMLLKVLYITLSFIVLLPFQCMANPNGSLGMVSNPGLLCWNSGKHTALVVLGIIGILVYPVAILGWASWITLMYPSLVSAGQGLQLVRRYRFLFTRFKPNCYYFGVVTLFRNFLVALTPIVLIEAPALQIIVLGGIFMISAAVQAWTRPWRTEASNIADILISLLLVIILLGIAPLLEGDQSEKESIVGGVVTALIFGGLTALLCILGHVLVWRFRTNKGYEVFLCHHKGAAGVLCRYIKMMLTKHARGNVFLDTDQLEDLDLIFDAVKCQTKTLVVVLTPQVLTHMWCAGEIVSAHRNKVPIVSLICSGYEHPDQSQIEGMPSLWTEKQKQTLANFGITMEMVKDAYTYLISLQATVLSRFGSAQEQENTIVELANRCKMNKRIMVRLTAASTRPRLLITGAVADAEALSVCMVLRDLMQDHIQLETAVMRSPEQLADAGRYAKYLVVVLSKGMLRDSAFANMLLVADKLELRLEIVTISADSGFEFPSLEFYSELERDCLGSPGPLGSGADLAKAYQSLLSVLALPLSPKASQGLLEKQVSEISRRFQSYATREKEFAVDAAADAGVANNNNFSSLITQPPSHPATQPPTQPPHRLISSYSFRN
ncbi:unnamed protein product [Polarella glacialis]|uniref:Uncharacterized protein n=1 Tax=Polarella glacialis TaxID=89957 RepID=A0A813JQD8_POLGL|nr:unnamed protein product [Polarella glacialis]